MQVTNTNRLALPVSAALLVLVAFLAYFKVTGVITSESETVQQIDGELISEDAESREFTGRTGALTTREVRVRTSSKQFLLTDFLEAHGSNPEALWALYKHFSAKEYAEKLRQMADTDSSAAFLVAMQGHDARLPIADRLAFLREAGTRFPTDGLILLCLAGVEAEAGNQESAAKILSDMAKLEFVSDFKWSDRIVQFSGLLEKVGLSRDEAWKEANIREQSISRALGFAIQQLNATSKWSQGNAAMSEQVSMDILEVTNKLNIRNDFWTVPDRTVRTLQIQALRNLPQDALYGDDGMTVGAYRDQLQKNYFRDMDRADWVSSFIDTAHPSVVSSFLEMNIKEGSEAAYRWAKSVNSRKQVVTNRN